MFVLVAEGVRGFPPLPLSYSDMIRIKEIQDAFRGLVGWEQSYDPARRIDDELTESESGLTYQAAHPLLTLEAVESVMPEAFAASYPAWDSVRPYSPGDKVSAGGKVWIALKTSKGDDPTIGDYNGDFAEDGYGDGVWAEYNMLSDWLRRLMDNGAAAVAQRFLRGKSIAGESRPLLERMALFDGAGRANDLVEGRGATVGFEIVPVRGMGVTAKIERIGLQTRGAAGEVTVRLFHSSRPEAVRETVCRITDTRGLFQWFDLKDWYLPYTGDNAPGGAWYLCYDQSELPAGMMAVNFARDWSREPCGTCNRGSLQNWRELTKYLQASPFRAPSNGGAMWDVEDNVYTSGTSYGLNFVVSVECDLTDFIIRQRRLFAAALQKQVAYDALRALALNPHVRVNRVQSNAGRADLLYELDGNPQGRATGLGKELEETYAALRIDTEKIDRICLTCDGRGVKYRSV